MVDVITLAIALHHVQEIINAGDDITDLQRAVIVFAIAGRADHLDRSAVIFLCLDFNLFICVTGYLQRSISSGTKVDFNLRFVL